MPRKVPYLGHSQNQGLQVWSLCVIAVSMYRISQNQHDVVVSAVLLTYLVIDQLRLLLSLYFLWLYALVKNQNGQNEWRTDLHRVLFCNSLKTEYRSSTPKCGSMRTPYIL